MVLPLVVGLVAKEAVTPLGSPLTPKVTLPEKPGRSTTATLQLAMGRHPGGGSGRLAGEAAKEKPP